MHIEMDSLLSNVTCSNNVIINIDCIYQRTAIRQSRFKYTYIIYFFFYIFESIFCKGERIEPKVRGVVARIFIVNMRTDLIIYFDNVLKSTWYKQQIMKYLTRLVRLLSLD